VPYETQVVSAHRTPDLLFTFAENAADRGLRVIIAGAGGAAHLPGMLAAKTLVPVLGVPAAQRRHMNGVDAVWSISRMPAGYPWGLSLSVKPEPSTPHYWRQPPSATATPLSPQPSPDRRHANAQKVLDNPDPRIPPRA
jgi:5-(carboxyamino)imidazole ribonucleotide mutase